KKASSTSKVLGCVGVVLVALVVGGGFFVMSWMREKRELLSQIGEAELSLPTARKAAEKARAPELAKDAFDAAESDERAGAEAKAKGDLAHAAPLLQKALKGYEQAAQDAKIAALSEALGQKMREKQGEQRKQDVERGK